MRGVGISTLKRVMRGALPIVAALSLVLSSGTSFAAGQTVVYNNIPDPTPANVPSLGFEATATSEFGGQLGFASNERTNPNVTVLMSSWACQTGGWSTRDCVSAEGATFNHKVTLNVYKVGADNEPGGLIVSQEKAFDMPYRPKADPTCPGGTGWRADDGNCYNGIAFPITFNLTGTTLPDKAIVSVAYNTAHYGASPLNVTGPYDSLNVGTNPEPSKGSPLPTDKDAYLNSSSAASYCPTEDTTVPQTGTFRLDSGCWGGYLPAFKVTAGQAGPTVPTDKDQCKKDGWKAFGNMFKNQGQCVSYTNHN